MTIKTFDMGDLHKRACLVIVSTKLMGVERKDTEASKELCQIMGCDPEVSRAVKKLVNPKNPYFAAIKTIRGLIRNTHGRLTGPWDDIYRVIDAKKFSAYERTMDELFGQFWEAVDEFKNAWPTILAEAEAKLGAMFKASDYPSAEDVRSMFNVDRDMMPLTDFANTILELDDARISKLQEDAVKKEKANVQALSKHIHEVLLTGLTEVVVALNEFGDAMPNTKRTRTFRDTLVEKMAALADLLPGLNITADPKLAKMASDIARKLSMHDPEALRQKNDEGAKLRKMVAKDAQEMVDSLGSIFAN